MVFVNRKPGETLILDTPNGKLIIQILEGNQLGIDAPAGVQVSGANNLSPGTNWLPARPRLVRVA